MSYTLFPCIASWLSTAAWQSCTSELSLGDEVTVECHITYQQGALEPSAGSFWAEVVSLPDMNQSQLEPERQRYGVQKYGQRADEPPIYVERLYLRLRKLETHAFIHISDDKTHDSHAAQAFLEKTLKYLEEEQIRTEEHFSALHIHSDNAPSHFKSSKTMHYLTSLPQRLKPWATSTGNTFRVVWEFGAPGHGKGVWDGIGAWMKRTVRQDIVDHRVNAPTILTTAGQILSAAQVHDHLKVRLGLPPLRRRPTLPAASP